MAAKKTATKAPAKKAVAKKPVEAEVQHPALEGEEGVEIAQRSADTDAASSDAHTKKYVVLARDWHGTDDEHRRNIEAARQAMISTGLRPTGDGEYVGSEDHPDGKSLILTYSIPARAAVVAHGETAHAHVTLADQHEADAEA